MMNSPRRLLTNATLVLPTGVFPGGSLAIVGGRIAGVGAPGELAATFENEFEVIDLGGAYVMPGLIDLHTDTLEKEITPRPAADFPVEVAVHELDRKLVGCGITTVYHSLHFGYSEGAATNRSRYSRREVIDCVRALAAGHTLAKTRIHARYEIVGDGPEAFGLVCELLEKREVELLSFMDHTPGQGQYTEELFISRQAKLGIEEAQARVLLAEKQARPRLTPEQLREVAELAIHMGVPIASHDDDTVEKVRAMHALGVTICEFPINLAAAAEARALGMAVLGGSSNVLRGGSLTGNLHIGEAMKAGAVNGLCSDYYPPSMLHAIFRLNRERVMALHEAVNAATLVPAQAAGIADETGSLEVGKEADLIVVRMRGETPVVTQAFVRGERVFAAGRERVAQSEIELTAA